MPEAYEFFDEKYSFTPKISINSQTNSQFFQMVKEKRTKKKWGKKKTVKKRGKRVKEKKKEMKEKKKSLGCHKNIQNKFAVFLEFIVNVEKYLIEISGKVVKVLWF